MIKARAFVRTYLPLVPFPGAPFAFSDQNYDFGQRIPGPFAPGVRRRGRKGKARTEEMMER